MAITLRQLRYFKAVVEHGSFTRAAESVFVSQPALSLQVRDLESNLGWPLFERDSHGVALTTFGREIHQQALRVLDEALLLETMGKRFNEGPFHIALGILSTLSPYLICNLQEELHKLREGIEIAVCENTSRHLLNQLLGGHIDAAIVSLPVGMLELSERDLFEDRLILAGSSERLAAFRKVGAGLDAENMAKSDIGPVLVLSEGHCLADQVLGACSIHNMEGVHRSLESVGSIARLAESSAGLALIPETAVATEQKISSGLHFMRLAEPEPQRRIGLIYRVAFEDQRWVEFLTVAAKRAGRRLLEKAGELID